MSRATRKYKALSALFFILSSILVIAPMAVFGFMAITSEMAWYCWLMFGMGVLLFLVDLLRHEKARASVWCILLGLCLAIESTSFVVLVSVTTGCVILDEFVFWPLHKMARRRARINREIDKRS